MNRCLIVFRYAFDNLSKSVLSIEYVGSSTLPIAPHAMSAGADAQSIANPYRSTVAFASEASWAWTPGIPASSNAATVLMGLNDLLQSRLEEKKLMAWGAKIGADVPFFIFQLRTSYCLI